MSRYWVDVCIPVYKEKGYLERTLKNLAKQNLYKQGKVHIAIGEYKDPESKFDNYTKNICAMYPNCDYIEVNKKGIGYARGYIADNIAFSDIMMCFDADSVFNKLDAIDRMIAPILDNSAVLTNCESISYDFENNRPSKFTLDIYNINDSVAKFNEFLFISRGQGLTVAKYAYDAVGGFKDIPQMEDTHLSLDVGLKYGFGKKRFIDDVKVFTSDRRAKAYDSHGVKVFDYSISNFR